VTSQNTGGRPTPIGAEELMIDNSHKGLFFAATALMCAAALYGSELAQADSEELSKAAGAAALPRQLTLPPAMKSDAPPELALQQTTLNVEVCGARISDASACPDQPQSEQAEPPQTPTAVKAEPSTVTNLGSAAQ
jgi:hypothetical protein